MLAYSVARGEYSATSWPEVVACGFAGCVMRRTAHGAPADWWCSDHDPSIEESVHQAAAWAQRIHADDDPDPDPTGTAAAENAETTPRRYRPAPTRRGDPEWTAREKGDAA